MIEQILRLDHDAFSDGQIGSKLWLCETLEGFKEKLPIDPTIWIYGGWYGVLSFLLFSRDRLKPSSIRSFDIDPVVETIADRLNNHWEIQNWKFKAHTLNVNKLDFASHSFGTTPSIVINTSCEHFDSLQWWNNIPLGTVVVLQATDMVVPDHVARVKSEAELSARFADMSKTIFLGHKNFAYPEFKFTRFMLIGVK